MRVALRGREVKNMTENQYEEDEYDSREFNDMVYFYVNEYSSKTQAKVEAHFQRLEGKYARVAKLSSGNWGVYNKEKW